MVIDKDYDKIKSIENRCPYKLEPTEKEHIIEILEKYSYLSETSLAKLRRKLDIKNN